LSKNRLCSTGNRVFSVNPPEIWPLFPESKQKRKKNKERKKECGEDDRETKKTQMRERERKKENGKERG
jgi:hypothetical protein